MSFLFVDPGGRVHSGRLTVEAGRAVLTRRAGEPLGAGEVLAILAPPAPTASQRALLQQAVEAGYRIETR